MPPIPKPKPPKIPRGAPWFPAVPVVGLLIAAVVAYTQSDKISDRDLYLFAAVAVGASGHLALAHVQRRLDRLDTSVIVSLSVVGIVAGIAGVLAAKLANSDATTLALAVAGLGSAIAGAETLTRLAARSVGGVAVETIKRTDTALVLTGQGFSDATTVKIGSKSLPVSVDGETLTADLPTTGADAGAPVLIGDAARTVQLALPKPP